MFSQVVQGYTNDPPAVRRAMERWAPTAGTSSITAGVAKDGRFVAVTTWESDEPARAATGEWHGILDGQVRVTNGARTDFFAPGDVFRARFVQVVQGQVTDLNEARRHKAVLEEVLATHLRCLLGTLTVEHEGERFTRALYFSTEEEARAGESHMPATVRRSDEDALRLLVGPVEYLDLQDPWLLSPLTAWDSA
jgi:hypothetical protein